MDGTKKKYGWTEKGIVGFIFTPMGLFFLILGVALWRLDAGDTPAESRIFLFVFGGMGAAFLLVGLGLLLADVSRRHAMRRAYEGGFYVMAKIVGTQTKTNVNSYGTNPNVVECHYKDPDTGEMHIYYSRYLFFNPSDMFTTDEVPVYIDRLGGKGVFVDIDAALPKVVLHK